MSNDPHGQTNQPLPKANNPHPAVHDLLVADIQARDKYGQGKYGQRLRPFNGRNSLRDAYEEVIDLAVYLRVLIYENEHAYLVDGIKLNIKKIFEGYTQTTETRVGCRDEVVPVIWQPKELLEDILQAIEQEVDKVVGKTNE